MKFIKNTALVAAANKPPTFTHMVARITNTRIASGTLLSTCEGRGTLTLLPPPLQRKKHLILSDKNKAENTKQEEHIFKNTREHMKTKGYGL